jgi:type I restriction-modification system DNA methylase subunit
LLFLNVPPGWEPKMNTEEFKKPEETLWASTDTLRANSDLKSSEYSTPVLGFIFLKFADNKFSQFEKEIFKEYEKLKEYPNSSLVNSAEEKIKEVKRKKWKEEYYIGKKLFYSFSQSF